MNDQKKSGESLVHSVSLAGSRTEAERLDRIRALVSAAGPDALAQEDGLVGIKIQVGRSGPLAPFPPQIARPIARVVTEGGGKPFVMEALRPCRDLCRDALDLHELTAGQGYTLAVVGAPIIVADGLGGNAMTEVDRGGSRGWVAMDAINADGLIIATGLDPSSGKQQGSALGNAADFAHAGAEPTGDAGDPAERAAIFLAACSGKTLFISLIDVAGEPSPEAPLDGVEMPCLLASCDPVALDQASLDHTGDRGHLPEILDAAVGLGLGSRSYKLADAV